MPRKFVLGKNAKQERKEEPRALGKLRSQTISPGAESCCLACFTFSWFQQLTTGKTYPGSFPFFGFRITHFH